MAKKNIKDRHIRLPKYFSYALYELFCKDYKDKTLQEQQDLINSLPMSVLRFDLCNYFRSLEKPQL